MVSQTTKRGSGLIVSMTESSCCPLVVAAWLPAITALGYEEAPPHEHTLRRNTRRAVRLSFFDIAGNLDASPPSDEGSLDEKETLLCPLGELRATAPMRLSHVSLPSL